MVLSDFRNEPSSDFRGNPEHRRRMKEALEEVKKELGREYDLVIGGKRIKTDDKLTSYNPAQNDQAVGVFSKADKGLAEQAILTADGAFKSWSRTAAEDRIALVVETARIIRERKYYYAAWMVYEVGKSWAEADADVAEAIDFCEFYARDMLRLAKPQP